MQGDKVFMKVIYPNSSSTEIRSRLRLRSTVRGANNRLDLLSIVSYDHADGRAISLAGRSQPHPDRSTLDLLHCGVECQHIDGRYSACSMFMVVQCRSLHICGSCNAH